MDIREEFREYLRESKSSYSNNAHIKIYCEDADIIIAEINNTQTTKYTTRNYFKNKYKS